MPMKTDLSTSQPDRPLSGGVPSVDPNRRTVSRRWLTITVIVVTLLALPSLRYPIGRDQATYSVIGHGLARGMQLYRDLWDNKPPGIFYAYAVITSIFGRTTWFVGLVDAVLLVITGVFIFCFAERYLGPSVGAVGAVAYTLWHGRGDYVSAVQPEAFILLSVFMAHLMLTGKQRWPKTLNFAAGALYGVAFWMKYNAGLFLLLGFFLPYLDTSGLDAKRWYVKFTLSFRAWFKRASFLAGGFVVMVAGPLAYFWISGIWPEFKQVQLEVLPRYATFILSHQPGYLPWVLSSLRSSLYPWGEAAVALALALAWWRNEVGRLAPVALYALTGFLEGASQLRFHFYYFEPLLPFLCIICAYVCVAGFCEVRSLSTWLRGRKMWLAPALLWLAFANFLYIPAPDLGFAWMERLGATIAWVRNPLNSYAHYWWPGPIEHLPAQMDVIRYIKNHTKDRDQVFVWGTAPLIYYLAGKEPPNRFVSNLALMSLWGPPAWRRELVRDLEKSPPLLVVVVRNDAISDITGTRLDSEQYLGHYQELADFLARDYQPAKKMRNFVIYRRVSTNEP